MPLRARRHCFFRTFLWTAIALAIGTLLLLATIGQLLPNLTDPVADLAGREAEFSTHFLFGLVALACFPFTLYIDGRTIPRTVMQPKVLAIEKLRAFLTAGGRGGEAFLDRDGSVESLQRRPGGWVPITLGLVGIFCGTIGVLGACAAALIAISLCARRSWILCIAVLVVGTGAQLTGFAITPASLGEFEFPFFIYSSAFFSMFVVIGVIRGAREQGLIDRAAHTLLRDRSRQERAIAEVRRGIARDMHDSLSHHLSVIAMYSGALSVHKDLDPASVRESARLIADSARRSGVELREVLTMLRGDDQGTVVDPELEPLVRGREDGVKLVYQAPLDAAALRDLGALERTTIYRFVQEAMTNAFKHAPGARLTITVAADDAPGIILLVASNPLRPPSPNGPLPSPPPQMSPAAGSGLGLLGLRERMEAMGGDLTVTKATDFVLRARIPAPGLGPAHADAEHGVQSSLERVVQPLPRKRPQSRTISPIAPAPPTEENA